MTPDELKAFMDKSGNGKIDNPHWDINHADLTKEIVGGNLTIQQALARIASERGGIAHGMLIPCDNCGKTFEIDYAWSASFFMAWPGHPYAATFQLQESELNSNPHQHFTCSESCLEQIIVKCMREHYIPESKARHVMEEPINPALPFTTQNGKKDE